MARGTAFQPLVDYLASRTEADVSLTFPEIEALLGVPLPISAYNGSVYWSGSWMVHTRAMRARGWRGRIDYRNQCVRFRRDAEDEQR